jgi:hypothetical protein
MRMHNLIENIQKNLMSGAFLIFPNSIIETKYFHILLILLNLAITMTFNNNLIKYLRKKFSDSY